MESELFRDLSELIEQFLVENVEVLLYFRVKKVARYVFCWISTMKTVWSSSDQLELGVLCFRLVWEWFWFFSEFF